jgi:hypothetical protein
VVGISANMKAELLQRERPELNAPFVLVATSLALLNAVLPPSIE